MTPPTAGVQPAAAGGSGGDAAPQTVSLYEKWRKIHPLWVSGGFQTGRRIVLVILLLVFYAGPWLQWNGAPGMRFDLTHRRFTILWSTFVPEEFVLLAWLLLIAALVLFTVTVAAGRVFCGWACPQTVWSLVYFTIERWVEGDRNARLRLEKGPWTVRKVRTKALKYGLWALVALSISITFVGYFEPIRELLPKIARFDLSGWEQVALLLPAAGSFLLSGVLREQVCFHMCPYARFQSVMFDHDSLIISYDEARGEPRGSRRRDLDPTEAGLGSCIDCRKCVNVCPTGIDIRDGLQYQCIGCAACVDACSDVMQTMGYGESLVRYSSQSRDLGEKGHWLRPRLVGYASVTLVLLLVFAYVVTHRVAIGLDIARDRNRLYRESWDGSVENVYTLRVANRSDRDERYRLSFESALPLVYDGPETIEVEARGRAVIPLDLVLPGAESSARHELHENAGDDERHDTHGEANDREIGERTDHGSGAVRFQLRSLIDPEVVVEKTSPFHLPERREDD